jgi:hypothetical protein
MINPHTISTCNGFKAYKQNEFVFYFIYKSRFILKYNLHVCISCRDQVPLTGMI